MCPFQLASVSVWTSKWLRNRGRCSDGVLYRYIDRFSKLLSLKSQSLTCLDLIEPSNALVFEGMTGFKPIPVWRSRFWRKEWTWKTAGDCILIRELVFFWRVSGQRECFRVSFNENEVKVFVGDEVIFETILARPVDEKDFTVTCTPSKVIPLCLWEE